MLQREIRVWIREIADQLNIDYNEALLAFSCQFSATREAIKSSEKYDLNSPPIIRYRFLGKFEPNTFKIQREIDKKNKKDGK